MAKSAARMLPLFAVESARERVGSKCRVGFEHFGRGVSGDAHDFAVGQISGLKQAADTFMPQIMKAEIFDARAYSKPPESFSYRITVAPHVENAVLTIDPKSRHFFENGQRLFRQRYGAKSGRFHVLWRDGPASSFNVEVAPLGFEDFLQSCICV